MHGTIMQTFDAWLFLSSHELLFVSSKLISAFLAETRMGFLYLLDFINVP